MSYRKRTAKNVKRKIQRFELITHSRLLFPELHNVDDWHLNSHYAKPAGRCQPSSLKLRQEIQILAVFSSTGTEMGLSRPGIGSSYLSWLVNIP